MRKNNKKHHHHHDHEINKEPKIETQQEIDAKLKRREFLKGAAALGLGTVAMSPFAKLLKRAEVAAQVGCNISGTPVPFADRRAYVNMALVGGIQFSTFLTPNDQNGGFYGNSHDMSKMCMSSSGTNRPMQVLGNAVSQPLYQTCGGTNTGFYQTLSSLVDPAALPNLHNLFIHGASASDSVAIRISPVYAINSQLQYAGNSAPFYANGFGNNVVNNGETYGKAMDARDAGLEERLLGVATEINGIKASSLPNSNFNSLPPNIRNSFFDSLNALSRRQFQNFLNPDLADKLADIYSCNIDTVRNLDPSLAAQLDIRQNAAAVAYFQNLGIDISTYADNDPRLLSMTMVALQAHGLSLGCNHQPKDGSFDYHFGGDISNVINQNSIYASHVAHMINTAHFFNIPLVITSTTDGGCSTNPGQLQPLESWSDRDFASGIHIIAYKPVDSPVRSSLGYYDTATQSAENTGPNQWSHDEQKQGLIAAYNTMRLMGYDEGSIAPPILEFLRSKLSDELDEYDMTKPPS